MTESDNSVFGALGDLEHAVIETGADALHAVEHAGEAGVDFVESQVARTETALDVMTGDDQGFKDDLANMQEHRQAYHDEWDQAGDDLSAAKHEITGGEDAAAPAQDEPAPADTSQDDTGQDYTGE